MAELLVYINGQFYPKHEAKISVYDHGLLYGDGVFEGIRAYKGIVFKLKEHVKRLYQSAHVLNLTIPLSEDDMTKAILDTLRINQKKDAYIRVLVTRGIGDLGLDPNRCKAPSVIIIADSIDLHSEKVKEGLRVLIVWVRRDSVDSTSHEVKSLNYLNSILAKIEANFGGYDEAILLDRNGYLCEGVGENLFIVNNKKIWTPPTSTGALRGITRDVVIQLSETLGYQTMETNLTPSDLFCAQEAFFTGTAAEIAPIVEVNNRVIGEGKPGAVTQKLIDAFTKLRCNPSEGFVI